MAFSSEFLDLCQAQVDLLTHGLGAAFSIVYLTDEAPDASAPDAVARLVPVMAYPEKASQWSAASIMAWLSPDTVDAQTSWQSIPDELASPMMQQIRSLPAAQELAPDCQAQMTNQDRAKQSSEAPVSGANPAFEPTFADDPASEVKLNLANQSPFYQGQVFTPLAHQGVVMGLLVTARSDRLWSEQEQHQIEQIAQTLASACVLDHRATWLELELRRQHSTYRQVQQQQQDQMDDLLHQIRNPLTALRTFGKLLLKRLEPDDQNRSVVEGIVRESDRLQDLLQQFDQTFRPQPLLPSAAAEGSATTLAGELDSPAQSLQTSPEPVLPSSRPLSGAQFLAENLQVAPHSIAQILEPLVDTAAAIAQDQGIGMMVDCPPNRPPVWVDLRAIREVLSNLIDNALKYTLEPGAVIICGGVATAQGQAIIVADTGLGIPQEDQDRLFQRHFRGVQAEGTIPGTGLGLAIARELLHQMRGDIQIVSPIAASDLVPPELKRYAERLERPGTAAIVWLPEAPGAGPPG
ncbi:MAG: sensor histidine kinase [Elainellaceae cyanobacterium]